MTIWAPGMRCVCVDDGPTQGRYVKSWFGLRKKFVFTGWQLVKGKIYTVTDVVRAYDRRFGEEAGTYVGLKLAEVHTVDPDDCFSAARFRPLSETRIDQFRKHLNRIPAGKVSA